MYIPIKILVEVLGYISARTAISYSFYVLYATNSFLPVGLLELERAFFYAPHCHTH